MSILSRQAGSGLLKGRLYKKRLPEDVKGQDLLGKIPFRKLVIASFIVSLSTIATVLILQNALPPQVPLFYGLPKTQQQLATSLGLIIPSMASLVIMLVNLFIAQILADEFLQKVLVMSGIVGVFFSTITTFKIVFLVGSF